ncbi:MAG: hypothetical protein CSYNP_01730 [Syntrophus sp. SKADARSKE-3]|nr:hypothetical protein [Syntrophus sp. SKADARSKE-3]
MRSLFLRSQVQFDPAPMVIKLRTLIRTKDQNPATFQSLKTKKVHKGYLRPASINLARAFYTEHRAILEKIRNQYCVPETVIVSILMVETRLGSNTGTRKAFNVLASMALCGDLDMVRDHLKKELSMPGAYDYARGRCREKSDWAYNELKALIRYARQTGGDPLSIPGSVYGAIGICQFMPSNVFLYGVDAGDKGHVDLFSSPDALYSIGNYLRMNGWTCRMDRGSRHNVILTYNRSHIYANTVLAVADRLQGNSKGTKKQRGRINREG